MRRFLIYQPLFLFAILMIASCSEKELVIPEMEISDVTTLVNRPSLRPDSVKVYPAYYQTVEVVYPLVQPERAVKSTINYLDSTGNIQIIEVLDFNEIITIGDIIAGETVFTIVYFNEQGVASSPVKHWVTPYRPLTDYVFESIQTVGEYGYAHVAWQNITNREVEVEIKYVDRGQNKTVIKRSSSPQDTIRIGDLLNIDYDFEIRITDPERNYTSSTLERRINPGISLQNYILSTLSVTSGYGRALVEWENPLETDVQISLSYEIDGTPKDVEFVTNDAKGNYTLVNLPHGNIPITANVKHLGTGDVSISQSYDVIINKGVKETVMDNIMLKSYNFNFATVTLSNPTNIPVNLTIEYEKASGGMVEQEIKIMEKQIDLFVPLYDIKSNAILSVEATDDIGSIIVFTNTNVEDVSGVPVEFNRENWIALASSERNEVQSAQRVLDGVFGGPTSEVGWVNQWGGASLDLTNTPSNVFPHFIQVDMREIKYVTGFRTINHANGVQNGAGTFILQYSIDGEKFVDAQTFTRKINPQSTRNESLSYTLDTPIVARYIRYYAVNSDSGSGTMRMAEFYVSGIE